MPRWLESSIKEHVGKGEDSLSRIYGTSSKIDGKGGELAHQHTHGTKGTNSDRTENGTKKVILDGRGSGTSHEYGGDDHHSERNSDVTGKTEETTTTRSGNSEHSEETNGRTTTETKVEDAGIVISFSIPITGGLGSSTSNPTI